MKNWKIVGLAVAGVVHALGMGLAMHSIGWNAHPLAILCLGYGAAAFYVLRRAFP